MAKAIQSGLCLFLITILQFAEEFMVLTIGFVNTQYNTNRDQKISL